MTGYVLENALGLVLSLAVSLLHLRSTRPQLGKAKTVTRCLSVARRGCQCFYDCAVFFTFSIQVACIVVLARLDFGLSASGMGDSTAKIVWAIALLTILPLTYFAFRPDLLRDVEAHDRSNPKAQDNIGRKQQLRFLLFALCWVLFMYPFLSRMMETFGPSMIGGSNPVISTNDWTAIATICLANVNSITNQETLAMNFFSVAGSLFVSILAVVKIVWLSMNRQHENSRAVLYIRSRWLGVAKFRSLASIGLFILIPVFATSQLWTIFRERSYQRQIAQASGNKDADSEWTFGQIAAVTIFVPVVVECWFAWLYD